MSFLEMWNCVFVFKSLPLQVTVLQHASLSSSVRQREYYCSDVDTPNKLHGVISLTITQHQTSLCNHRLQYHNPVQCCQIHFQCLYRSSHRSIHFFCRTGWIYWSEAKVLHLQFLTNNWTRLNSITLLCLPIHVGRPLHTYGNTEFAYRISSFMRRLQP